MEKRSINATNGPQPVKGYSQAIEVRNHVRTLYLSGQIPASVDRTVPKAFPDQARLAWRNVEAQLHAADMTLDNLVKVTIFLSDRSHVEQNRAVRNELIGNRNPALTVVIAGLLDSDWLLEIEAVAAS